MIIPKKDMIQVKGIHKSYLSGTFQVFSKITNSSNIYRVALLPLGYFMKIGLARTKEMLQFSTQYLQKEKLTKSQNQPKKAI